MGIDVRVPDIDEGVAGFQLGDDVGHLGVAKIRTIFLEGNAHDQDAAARHRKIAAQHELDDLIRDMRAHAVVDAAACKNDFGMVADLLGLVSQVVGVDADAMAAHQTGAEGQEIPLGASGGQHLVCVDAELAEDQRQLVHERDVEIALGVLDDLCGLGDADAGGLVRAGGDDAGIKRVDGICGGGSRSAGHLQDGGEAMRLIAGIDALRAVAGEEIAVEGEAADPLENGNAIFLGAAGIDRRFIDYDGAGAQRCADGL